jgi:hypothetical protein
MDNTLRQPQVEAHCHNFLNIIGGGLAGCSKIDGNLPSGDD